MANKELLEKVKSKLHYGNDASIDRKAEKWVLEPLIPCRGITIIDGLGGTGKSWFMLDISYSICTGQAFVNKFPVKKSGKVLYLTAEESEETFVERLDIIQKHYPETKDLIWLSFLEEGLGLMSYLCTKKRGDRVATETAEILEELVKEIQPIVTILDSFINFYGLNENDSEDAVFFYEVLKHLIREYKTNFVLLHHQNKEAMRGALADDIISFRGSGVLREQARSRIVYKNIKINEKQIARKIILEKSNYFSSLKDEVSKGLYLRFENGKHKYDEQFALIAKRAEEEAKNKSKKKKGKESEGLGNYEVDF